MATQKDKKAGTRNQISNMFIQIRDWLTLEYLAEVCGTDPLASQVFNKKNYTSGLLK